MHGIYLFCCCRSFLKLLSFVSFTSYFAYAFNFSPFNSFTVSQENFVIRHSHTQVLAMMTMTTKFYFSLQLLVFDRTLPPTPNKKIETQYNTNGYHIHHNLVETGMSYLHNCIVRKYTAFRNSQFEIHIHNIMYKIGPKHTKRKLK